MTETVPRIPLQSWIEDHISRIPDRMLWRWAAVDQIGYLCELASLVNVSPGERHAIGPVGAYVIATHRSKSIELPVVSLERPDLGIQFVLCNNFYHTKLSVISERPLVDEAFPYLFHTQPPPDPTRAASARRPARSLSRPTAWNRITSRPSRRFAIWTCPTTNPPPPIILNRRTRFLLSCHHSPRGDLTTAL